MSYGNPTVSHYVVPAGLELTVLWPQAQVWDHRRHHGTWLGNSDLNHRLLGPSHSALRWEEHLLLLGEVISHIQHSLPTGASVSIFVAAGKVPPTQHPKMQIDSSHRAGLQHKHTLPGCQQLGMCRGSCRKTQCLMRNQVWERGGRGLMPSWLLGQSLERVLRVP